MTTEEDKRLRQAAEENQSKYARLVGRTDDPVLVHPILAEGFAPFCDVNACACRTYGYSREEFLRLSAPDITDPQDVREHATREFRHRLLEAGHLTVESRHRKRSGESFPVEIDATILEHEGAPLIIAVIRDISEQRRAEQALVESERRFRTLIEQATDALYVARMDGSLVEVNAAACRDTGYPREELLRLNVRDLDPESEEQDDHQKFWEDLSMHEPVTLLRHHVRKDGSRFPVEIRTAAAHLHGERVVMGFCRDISERIEQERRLRESERRFRKLAETVSSLAIQGYDEDGTVFFWNEANVPIYGYTADEAVGRNLVDLIIPDEMADSVRRAIAHAGRTGEMPPPAELSLQRKDGSRAWVYSSHVSVEVGGRYELYCLDVDLSSMKEAQAAKETALAELTLAKEAAESANRAKDEFLAVMSHEMRTPLNPIVGYASLMLEECREDQRPLLETILNSSDRLLGLIEDILNFAKLDRGDLKMQPSWINFRELCRAALDDIHPKHSALDIQFRNGFAGADPVPPEMLVYADRNLLLRVLDNLLTNACKYTPSGFVRLEVGMRPGRHGTAQFFLAVEDSGIGVAEENLEALFEPFNQVDRSYTRKYEGVGLGLAVSRKLVELMRGRLRVTSEPGKGSRFWFEVPLSIRAQGGEHSKPATPGRPLAFERPMHILVAEDRPDNAALVQHIISRAGGTCRLATTGLEAVAMAGDETFDLILMDLSMPEMDGFEAAERILEGPNPNEGTPILAVSAHVSDKVKAQCEAVGMCGHLSKPIVAADLVSALNELPLRPSDG